MPMQMVTEQALRFIQVTDNEMNHSVSERFLSRAGHQVISVVNGAKAREMLDTEDFDIILFDLDGKGVDGLEFTRQLSSLEKKRDRRTPVIAITGYVDESERQVYLDAGLDHVLTKPLDAKTSLSLSNVSSV